MPSMPRLSHANDEFDMCIQGAREELMWSMAALCFTMDGYYLVCKGLVRNYLVDFMRYGNSEHF